MRITLKAAILAAALLFVVLLASCGAMDPPMGSASTAADAPDQTLDQNAMVSGEENLALRIGPTTGDSCVVSLQDGSLMTYSANRQGSQIGSDPRLAVVRECWYALRGSAWLNPNKPIEGPYDNPKIAGNVVGNWNYLASDTSALNWAINKVGRTNASVTYSWVSMSGNSYAMYQGYERTGECLFFANLILKRSRGYTGLPTWAKFPSWGSQNAVSVYNAVPGDIIYKRYGHIAIVVKVDANGIDTVDSNYCGYGTYPIGPQDGTYPNYSEICGRHWYSFSYLTTNQWLTYKGASRWY
jgi:hypothetical protein